MLKDSIGGTVAAEANSEAARKIVPSPPSVETKSTLSERSEEAGLEEASVV